MMSLPLQAAPVSRSQAGSRSTGLLPSTSLCTTATIQNGQACINVPVLGSYCVPVPSSIPNGTAASVCASTCGFVPCGASVTVTVLGQSFQKSFGCC